MFGKSTIKLFTLRVAQWERLWSNAIPQSLNKLNAFLNAELQKFIELGWTHASQSTLDHRWAQ